MDSPRTNAESSLSYQRLDESPQGRIRPIKDGMRGTRANILLHAAFLVLPMALFCAVLLGLVFAYRTGQGKAVSDSLTLAQDERQQGFYYVRLNATFLIFVASWSSSLAATLGVSIIALWTYPAAARWLKDSEDSNPTDLPSPFQFGLVLSIVSGGGFGALWTWMRYLVWWETGRMSQSRLLRSMGLILLLSCALWLLVFVADTWLHLVTETVPFTTFKAVSTLPDAGFRLSKNCTRGDNSLAYQESWDSSHHCSIVTEVFRKKLINAPRALAVLNKGSNFGRLSVYDNGTDEYLYMSAPHRNDDRNFDFTATTFGLKTQCLPKTRACNLSTFYLSEDRPKNCTSGYTINSNDGVGSTLKYFQDAGLTNAAVESGVENPFHFAWRSMTNREWSEEPENPEVVTAGSSGGMFFLLFCSTTVYDIKYNWVNGTVRRFDARESNTSVTNIVQATTQYSATIIDPYVQQAAGLAVFLKTPDELATFAARHFSEVALSLMSPSLVRIPAIRAQRRSQILVTRVPTNALWCLVLANLLFVVTGLALMAIALAISDEDVRQAQARLSIAGLVAERFEDTDRIKQARNVEELFEETRSGSSPMIGVQRLDAGELVFRKTKGDELLKKETQSME